MDDITLLMLLGAMAFVFALSLVLQVLTIRNVQALKKRLAALPARPSEPVQRPQKTEFTTVVSSRDLDLKPHNSIEESIRLLSELARVEWITLSTRDGLVVASNYPNAQADAAIYSDLMNRGGETSDPAVKTWQIDHRAGTIVGIARSKEPITGERWAFLTENVSKILNYWL
jgi:hypothetical protein